MLVYIKINNFLSFGKEIELSFEPTSNKEFADYYISNPLSKLNLLNLCLLFGPNGSGKSNLAKAFLFLKEFVLNTNVNIKGVSRFISFASETNNKCDFELCFVYHKTKFKYFVELNSTRVENEELYFFPAAKPALIFARKLNGTEYGLTFGSKIDINELASKTIEKYLSYSESFFYAYKQSPYNNQLIKDAMAWFDQGLDVATGNNNFDKLKKELKEDKDLRKAVVDLLQKIGFGINNIKFQQDIANEKEFKNKINDPNLTYFEKEQLLKGGNHISFEYKKTDEDGEELSYLVPEEFESDGLVSVLSLTTSIIKMSKNKSLLIIDGTTSNIHPHVIRFLLREFLLHRGVYSETQLFLTSHDISLLSEKDMLRKDAIWFMDKMQNGFSDLYSLADFNIRKELSYYNAYNLGKFGATPDLD